MAKFGPLTRFKIGEVRAFGKRVRLDIFGLCQSGGMADATDSKSVARKGVWVQVPPLVFLISFILSRKSFGLKIAVRIYRNDVVRVCRA